MAWHEVLYEVLNNINTVVLYIIGIPFGLQIIYMLFFWIKKKVFPKSDKKARICVVIPARNEESVIEGTVKDLIKNQTYPMELVDIYVIAHNCTDKTKEYAERAGAKVIVVNSSDPKTHRVSYCFNEAIKVILATNEKYDFLLRFDADNHVNKEFISLMNDAFQSGVKIARPYESVLNITESTYSQACGLYYVFDSRFSSRVRERLGIDAHVNGPGSMISWEIIEKYKGYDTKSICEDTEFCFKRIRDGYRCHFVEDAVVYEDLPTSLKDTYARNRRIGSGTFRLFCKYFFIFLADFFRTLRFSYLELILTYIFIPICALLCTWIPAFYIYSVIYFAVVGRMADLYLTLIIIACCLTFLFLFAGIFQGFLLVLLDYKKMGATRRRDLTKGVITFPFFSVVYIITITLGIFSKPKWKQVKRSKIKWSEDNGVNLK